jgi:predicted nucleotidyltransferase
MISETILGYKASWRILELLAETPSKPVARADVKMLTKLGNEAVNTALKRLLLAEIVIQEKNKKKELYYLNLSNPFTVKIVEFLACEKFHLKNISFDVLSALNEFTRQILEKTYFVKSCILFGSVAKGTARVDSDVDVAVIIDKKDLNQEVIITSVCGNIEKIFKKKIQVHYFTEQEFLKKTQLISEIKNVGINLLLWNKNVKY